MNRLLVYAASLISVFALTGCLETRDSVKASEEKQVMQTQVKSMQQTNADVRARFQELEDDDRKMTGRIEALEYRTNQLSQNSEKGNQADGAKIKELNDKLTTYQQALTKMDGDITELRSAIMQMQANQQAAATSAPPQGKATATSGADAFTEAEALFKQGSWREAILAYEKYRKSTPKGKQVGDATYKIGVCFQELGMADEARAFYEEVSARFPKSKEAGRASIRLKSLKK